MSHKIIVTDSGEKFLLKVRYMYANPLVGTKKPIESAIIPLGSVRVRLREWPIGMGVQTDEALSDRGDF